MEPARRVRPLVTAKDTPERRPRLLCCGARSLRV